jgi:hypothetical protein
MEIKQLKTQDFRLLQFAKTIATEVNVEDFNIRLSSLHFLKVSIDNIYSSNCGYFVAIDNDKIVGVMSCHIMSIIITKDTMIAEDFFGVLKEAKPCTGMLLIRAAMKWAKENNCKHFLLGANMCMLDKIPNAQSIYKRMGFKEYEKIYIKEIM